MNNDGMYLLGSSGNTSYYVDPDGGSDANAGASPSTAMQTIPAAVSKTKIGDWVLLRRGARFFTHLSIPAPYRHFGTYGQGVKPIVDASTAVTGGWTQHGTYSNIWFADVTLSFATGGDYSSARAGAWHPALWDEAIEDIRETTVVLRQLRGDAGISSSATQTQMLDAVDAQPNTFCVFRQGSSDPEPRNASQVGTDWRVYLHTRDGSNPNTNGRSVRIAEDRWALVAGEGQRWHDIVFQRSGGKDMVGVHPGDIKPEIFKGCEFLDAAVHALVVGGVTFEDCRAVAHKGHTDAIAHGGGGYHQYRGGGVGTSLGFQIKDCYAEGFAHAVYSHGGPSIQHEHAEVSGLEARNCTNVFQSNSRRGVIAKNVRALDCGNLSNVPIVIEDSEIYISGYIRGFYGPDSSRTVLRNCFVCGCGYLLYPVSIGAFLDDSNRPTLTLENSTVYSKSAVESTFDAQERRKFNLTLRSSIVSAFPMITGVLDKDASSTYESLGLTAGDQNTMGKLHTVEFAIGADDIIWINNASSRRVTWSGADNGDGTASLAVNTNDRNFGTWIKIADGNGPGNDYQGRIVSNGSGTSSPLIVSPVPGAAFTSALIQIPVFRHYIHRDAISAVLSEDGTQLRVADGRFFFPGNAIRVGPLGFKEYGLRYVTAVDGNIVTLDQACPWKHRGENISYNSLDGVTLTTRRSLPVVNVSFGFPIYKRRLNEIPYPKVSAMYSDRTPYWERQQATNQTARFEQGSASEVPQLLTGYGPDGMIRTNQLYNGGIQHELGYWDFGVAGMGIGDVLKFEFMVDIEEEKVRFDVDPAYLRRYLPSKDSRPFQRQAGYRG